MQTRFRAFMQRFPRVHQGGFIAKPENDRFSLTVSWPDYIEKRRRKFQVDSRDLTHLKNPFGFPKTEGFSLNSFELSAEVVCHMVSPSHNRMACLSLIPATDGKSKSVLRVDVWDKTFGKIVSAVVDHVHGMFVSSEGIVWHDSEQYFAYVAEKSLISQAEEFTFNEDLGEGFEGVIQPRIILFDLKTKEAKHLLPTHEDVAQFSPRFSPSTSLKIVYHLYRLQNGLKLGLLHCKNRLSEIRLFDLSSDLKGNDVFVSKGFATTDCPTFSSDGSKVIFFSTLSSFDTHSGPVQLSIWDPILGSRCLVDNIYPSQSLSNQCVFAKEIFLSVFLDSRQRTLRVNYLTGEHTFVESMQDKSSYRLLAVSPVNGKILKLESDPLNPGTIWLNDKPVYQTTSSQCKHSFHIVQHNCLEDNMKFDSILYSPGQDSSRPLIVCPHGGPHSVFTTDHLPEFSFLSQELNCGLLLVNYRGSTGSLDSLTLNSLPGKIGCQDVADVIQALNESILFFDSKRLAIMGGSHGGFLTAHLSGQYPDLFSCAVLRNPVIDVSTMLGVTDIPDWCAVEALGEGSFSTQAWLEGKLDVTKMREKSPIHHVHKVKIPTLICCGMKDRRVPFASQGLLYYRLLKTKGVDATLLRFPSDGHAIEQVGSSEAMWVKTVEFMEKHLVGKVSHPSKL